MKPAADNAYSYQNKSQGLINYIYEASISLNVKGTEYEVNNILHIYTTIDLSVQQISRRSSKESLNGLQSRGARVFSYFQREIKVLYGQLCW